MQYHRVLSITISSFDTDHGAKNRPAAPEWSLQGSNRSQGAEYMTETLHLIYRKVNKPVTLARLQRHIRRLCINGRPISSKR